MDEEGSLMVFILSIIARMFCCTESRGTERRICRKEDRFPASNGVHFVPIFVTVNGMNYQFYLVYYIEL